MKRLNKRPRLKDFDYKGCYRYFITICTHDRTPLFTDDTLVKQLIEALRNKSTLFGFKVWVFCFMPDHFHLLLEGKSHDSDLKRFIASYKQYTGYHCKIHLVAQGFSPDQKEKPKVWQPSYYDHILRKDEDIFGVARYILENPIRKRLVEHFLDYKFNGSFELDIRDAF